MDKKEQVYCLGFNQDYTGFSVATDRGFKIYNTSPLKLTVDRDLEGGIAKGEMLYRSNIVGLIGGGEQPKYPTTKLILWDDLQYTTMGEITTGCDVKAI